MPSKQTMITVGVVGLAAAVGAYFYFNKSKSEDKKEESKDTKSKTEPKLTCTTVIKVLTDVHKGVQRVLVSLMEKEQRMRMAKVPQQEMQMKLMKEFEERLTEMEKEIYKKEGTSEDEVAAACEFYKEMDTPDAKKVSDLMTNIKALLSAVTGVAPDDLGECPAGLTLDKFLEILEEGMEDIAVSMETASREVRGKAELANASPQMKQQACMARYQELVEEKRIAREKKYGFSQKEMQAANIKYGREPKFTQTIQRLHYQQEMRMKKIAQENQQMQ